MQQTAEPASIGCEWLSLFGRGSSYWFGWRRARADYKRRDPGALGAERLCRDRGDSCGRRAPSELREPARSPGRADSPRPAGGRQPCPPAPRRLATPRAALTARAARSVRRRDERGERRCGPGAPGPGPGGRGSRMCLSGGVGARRRHLGDGGGRGSGSRGRGARSPGRGDPPTSGLRAATGRAASSPRRGWRVGDASPREPPRPLSCAPGCRLPVSCGPRVPSPRPQQPPAPSLRRPLAL